MVRLINPEMKLLTFGKATLNSLKKANIVTSKKVKVRVKRNGFNNCDIYLLNATTYEQNVFSDSIMQIFSEMKQPRYIIAKPKNIFKMEYYVVPDVFKKNKDTAQIFANALKKRIGNYAVIFAKSEDGKNEVVKAKKILNRKFGKININTKNKLM